MSQLTPEGERIVASIAERYAISVDAVKSMLDAVLRGGGSMAQFNVPELGGNGQWMRGGMTMVGDMFNNSLKATVDNLCYELSNLVANQPGIIAPYQQSQSQSQGGGGGFGPSVSIFVPQSSSYGWWPSELGSPSSTGSQNSVRYAYFPGSQRLAIDYGGRVEVYDTSGHDIQGFGQQQSGDASLTFTSQRGLVRIDSLPKITQGEPAPQPVQAAPIPQPVQTESPVQTPVQHGDSSSILALLEQLGQLKEKGILTEEEFVSKKAELLKRL